MQLKTLAAAALLAVSSLAHAAIQVVDFGGGVATLTIDTDTTTALGGLSTSSSNTGYGFEWVLPTSVQVVSTGALQTLVVQLPTFTLQANAGYTLNGVFSAFLGNLAYTEIGGATTGILAYADTSLNGGLAQSSVAGVPWESSSNGAGYNIGFFGGTKVQSFGDYQSITISNASIVLSATGGSFSSITANSQNKLKFEFQAAAVPEPESYALLLAGLSVVGFLARRRQR